MNDDDLIRVEGSRTLSIGEAKVRVADDGEGRIVYGRIVPYNRVATVNDGAGPYREMFAKGAFTRSIEQRSHKIKLLVNHDRTQLPIGRAMSITDDPGGPLGEFLVSKRHLGLVEDVKDEILDSFSIRFRGIDGEKRDGVVVRTEAALGDEVSIVGFPAYTDAEIAGVRSDLTPDIRALIPIVAARFSMTADEAMSLPAAALLALADPGTGNPDPPKPGHVTAAVRAAQLRALDLTILKGRSL